LSDVSEIQKMQHCVQNGRRQLTGARTLNYSVSISHSVYTDNDKLEGHSNNTNIKANHWIWSRGNSFSASSQPISARHTVIFWKLQHRNNIQFLYSPHK